MDSESALRLTGNPTLPSEWRCALKYLYQKREHHRGRLYTAFGIGQSMISASDVGRRSLGATKAIFCLSVSNTSTCQYPVFKYHIKNHHDPCREFNEPLMWGYRKASIMATASKFLQSLRNRSAIEGFNCDFKCFTTSS